MAFLSPPCLFRRRPVCHPSLLHPSCAVVINHYETRMPAREKPPPKTNHTTTLFSLPDILAATLQERRRGETVTVNTVQQQGEKRGKHFFLVARRHSKHNAPLEWKGLLILSIHFLFFCPEWPLLSNHNLSTDDDDDDGRGQIVSHRKNAAVDNDCQKGGDSPVSFP